MSDPSTVWWASLDTEGGSPAEKIVKLLERTGFPDRLQRLDNVAIKLHMSEAGNVRGIRPLWVRRLADAVKQAGAAPFVTDTTTLYRHQRSTAQAYLQTAARHGFTAESMGCPIIIADGFHHSGTYVELDDAEYDRVHVAQAIFEADAMISLARCTFHPAFPIAGTLKNIGMGCTTKEAKMAMHQHEAAPRYNAERCAACWVCVRICPGGAFSKGESAAEFDIDKCVGCGDCIGHCKGGALQPRWDADQRKTQRWTLDAVRAVLSTFEDGKVVHLGLGADITRECDCGTTGMPVICDTGIFASSDPIALDRSMWDKLHEAPLYPGGALDKIRHDPQESQAHDLESDRATPLWRQVGTRVFWEEIVPDSKLGNLDYTLETLG